ncbi:MAG: alpha-galactosidase [Firmicutes bacterium]|nr:alpha-galactosidase [Bacillota bacterium]
MADHRSRVLEDCYVAVADGRLVIGNSLIERSWDCKNGHFGTVSFVDKTSGREWVPAAYGGQETTVRHSGGAFNLAGSDSFDRIEFEIEIQVETPLASPGIRTTVTLGTTGMNLPKGEHLFAIKKHFLIYPRVPAVRSYVEIGADTEIDGLSPGTVDSVRLAADELLATAIQLHDDTDNTNLLVTRRKRRVLPRMVQCFAGNILLVENAKTGDGVFAVKESPVHDSQLFPGIYDLRVNPLSIEGMGFDRTKPGGFRRSYGAVLGVYRGGEAYGIAALKEYQKARYKLVPERDYMITTNPWEGHIQNINEGAILGELDCARELGLSHLQIDYGWFGHYMTDFDREKFPNEFVHVRSRADEAGIKLGLWMNPMGVWSGSPMVKEHPDWVAVDGKRRPVESFRFVDPVLGMDLCSDGFFEHMKQLISGYRVTYGIVNPKMDMFQLDRYQTQLGDLYDHYEAYERLQQEVRELHPDIAFIQDVTVGKRPSYDFALEYGIITLENRYLIGRAGRYYPHQTLNNLWQLAPYVPPQKLLIEVHHDAPGYSPSYTFAIAMFANPMFWEALASMSPGDRHELKSLIALYKEHRDAIFSGHILPVGEEPSGSSWTGFQSHDFATSGGYAIVFREAHPSETGLIRMEFLQGKTVRFQSLTDATADVMKASDKDEVEFRLGSQNSFRLYRYIADQLDTGDKVP